MKSRQIASLVVVSASATFAASADAAVYNYFDTTFANVNWVGTLHANTSVPSAVFSATQSTANGGSPLSPATPFYRETKHTFGGPGGGGLNVAHNNVTFNWTPAPGEVASVVSYSYDLIFDNPTAGGAVGYAPAIFQGGNVYRNAPYDGIFAAAWTRFNGAGLPISAFGLITPGSGTLVPGSNPVDTAPMSFGYVSSNSANQPSTFKQSGLDNYGLRLVTVPEPSVLGIAAIGGSALALRRRRRV